MTRVQTTFWSLTLSFYLACQAAHPQSVQFAPEVDAHYKIGPVTRVYLQAKDDRDAGASSQLAIGPSVQFYVKPVIKLKNITALDLDDSKSRALVLESGYRYIDAPNAPSENRMETIATFHFPLKEKLLITDRNRADLDWKNGTFTWRYRNKVTIERGTLIHNYYLIPYVAAEPYYESQYSKWSTTALYAGCILPAGSHVQFNPYYEHENNTGKHPNQPQNIIGLALYLYFSSGKKLPHPKS
jgi:hypothetical protein